jgi:hypothetical protein
MSSHTLTNSSSLPFGTEKTLIRVTAIMHPPNPYSLTSEIPVLRGAIDAVRLNATVTVSLT